MSVTEDAFNDTFSSENNMTMVMRNIYEACDDLHTDKVNVSKLVEYIKPFMEANVSDLNKLKESLDPNDSDPEISSCVFYSVMTNWAKEFKQEESFHSISPRYLDTRPLIESTPRKSFGNRQQRVYAEAAAINLSVVEQTSFLGTDCNESVLEKSVLEEQIKQLTHQSKKYNDELLMARSQLIFQEEQNMALQSEIEKLTRDVKHERDINDALITETKTFEEMRENSFNKQKCIDKLKKEMQQLEKENQQLQVQHASLDLEHQKTEEKMSSLHEKLAMLRKETIELRTEISVKEEQLSIAEDVKKDLLDKIQDLNDSVANLQEANTCLKVEKEKVSKLLQDNLKLQSQAALTYVPQKDQSEYSVNDIKTQSQSQTTVDSTCTPTTKQLEQQQHDILKYFTPNSTAKDTQDMTAISQTSLVASTPEIAPLAKAPSAKQNSSRGVVKQNGRLSDMIHNRRNSKSLNDGSPIPFVSPIKTSKFTFFNFDSPIAKRCTLPCASDCENSEATQNSTATPSDTSVHVSSPFVTALIEQAKDLPGNDSPADQVVSTPNDSKRIDPQTPADLVSQPCMYVVERTTDRRTIQSREEASFDESVNDEELMQVAFSSIANAGQASVLDELCNLRGTSSTTSSIMGSERSCVNCTMQFEVKRRLDDLCDQIQWLKTENSSLREAEEQFASLVKSKQHLEDVALSRNQKIEELNKTLQVLKIKESGLMQENEALVEQLSNQQQSAQDLHAKIEEIAALRSELNSFQREQEKLLLENSIQQSVNERLTDDLKSLERHKKCLELKMQNILAEKEKLLEEHKIDMDDYANQMQQLRDDIAQLEEKFYASHEQVTLLLAEKEEATSASAKLFLKHQKLLDTYVQLQTKLQYYTDQIEGSSTKILPPQQKLQLLLKTKENYEKLELRYENLMEEKQKSTKELSGKIVELEKKCNQTANTKDAPKKTPHDRAQIKIEKLREKVDYLEESLKKQKHEELSSKNDLEHLQKCYESLIKEKLDLLKETEENQKIFLNKQNLYRDLVSEVKDILNYTSKVRYNMLKFSKSHRSWFHQFESVDGFLRHLEKVDIDDITSHLTLMHSTPDSLINPKEVANAKNDLQTIALILDALCNQQLRDIPIEQRKGLSVAIKPLGFNPDHIARPMSPDSPNLGALDVTNSLGEAGDHTMIPLTVPEHENTEYENDDSAVSEDELDGLASDPFDSLRRMYLPENLEFLITSVRLSESSEAPDNLEAFVDEFALTFTVDCSGYKNRLRTQFVILQEVVTRLVGHLQTLASQALEAKRRKVTMTNIANCLFELAKSAEQYGAIQQEVQASKTINQLMRHIIHLRDTTGKIKHPAEKLRSETVHVGSIQHTSPSASGQLSNVPPNRIMALLNAMRPSNVVRLVGAAAVAFLVYYFSQRFVFMLAASGNRSGDSWRRNSVCWASWLDLLAACFGRVHSNGPPPI